ncbi:dipeptidase [Rhizobium paknamense]|uniref:Membrane dipeptidase n=1 Tax=Rhizobium paknamense TaxID=1206817 RepID=A0ABU0IFC2_9HYPH|nr:dipeptidase [Rhizobium paknamense]MDQ0456155.1 membrane dipeptidase [Rhizobium paknamense]
MHLVFDGHNDVLLRLWRAHATGIDPVRQFIEGTRDGHIDARRARAGGLGGGLCAIYIPSMQDFVLTEPDARGHYVTPVDKQLERAPSLDIANQMMAIAFRLERAGGWRICRSTADIRRAFEDDVFAAVLHMEGCEAIDADLAALEVFHKAGLRSLGPVWSRPNIFGHGVPFAFPMSPDTGPGLTPLGFELIKACNRLGILVDLAHITEKGFWDVARTSDQPLIASHSNVHALTPVARNLTDRQLDAIRESGGLVGLNYAVTMLRSDARDFSNTPLSDMVRHIDYLVNRVGIDCVALGSDFDGCTVPDEIGDASGNHKLLDALTLAGYGDPELKKISRENWLRVLGRAWHEA